MNSDTEENTVIQEYTENHNEIQLEKIDIQEKTKGKKGIKEDNRIRMELGKEKKKLEEKLRKEFEEKLLKEQNEREKMKDLIRETYKEIKVDKYLKKQKEASIPKSKKKSKKIVVPESESSSSDEEVIVKPKKQTKSKIVKQQIPEPVRYEYGYDLDF